MAAFPKVLGADCHPFHNICVLQFLLTNSGSSISFLLDFFALREALDPLEVEFVRDLSLAKDTFLPAAKVNKNTLNTYA